LKEARFVDQEFQLPRQSEFHGKGYGQLEKVVASLFAAAAN
jgi:hypothetical protein